MPIMPLNTVGAASYLHCSKNWVHKLAYNGRLKAYAYNEQGVLVEHPPRMNIKGQGLYFYEADLKKYKARKPGRPHGAKDKKPRSRVLKNAKNSS